MSSVPPSDILCPMSRFILPADWDRPGEENEELCKRFGPSEIFAGLMYRLYTPRTDRSQVPLAVFLHGADAFGNDNISQLSMHDVGTVFTRDDWQKDEPCYVVCPQCRSKMHWSMPEMQEEVVELVQMLIERMSSTVPAIDVSRLYIYGYSAGAIGTLQILKSYPDIFAGAISICGATGRGDIENLLDTPLWLMHADDDRIVKISYGDDQPLGIPYYLGSRDIYEILKDDARGNLLYTEYPAGHMKKAYGVNPHCTWVCLSGDEGIPMRKWLFRQKRTG